MQDVIWNFLDILKGLDLNVTQVLPLVLAAQTLLDNNEKLPNTLVQNNDEFDFIIVGAGSAGAVLAARLSEVARWRVLLVEAGGDPPLSSTVPGLQSELVASKWDWGYYSEDDGLTSQAQKIPGRIACTRGKMIGGTSGINFMGYFRGNPDDYDGWAEAGFEGWDWNSVLPYFIKSEGMQYEELLRDPLYSSYHNPYGPLKVSQPTYENFQEEKLEIIQESFSEIGFNRLLDYNGPEQLGISKMYFTHSKAPNSTRSSTNEFLKPVINRENLFILKNAYATKVLIDPSYTAIGVEVVVNKTKIQLFAKKEVIASAGAYNTPKLLISSGVGPQRDLINLGIDEISNLPVGEQLLDHPFVPIVLVGENIQATNYSKDPAIVFDRLPLTLLTGFFSENSSNSTDMQLLIYYFSADSPEISAPLANYQNKTCQSILDINNNYEVIIIYIVLLHQKSRGRVEIENASEESPPKIHTGFFSDERDFITFNTGIKRVLNILKTKYFKSVGASIASIVLPQCDMYEFMTDSYWDCYVLNMATSTWHPSGTCAMGNVVDTKLKVYGVNRLRVVDASVFPSMPSGNINAPVIMVAERAADFIKEEFYDDDLNLNLDGFGSYDDIFNK